METRIYTSDLNVQFDRERVNYIEPQLLYSTIELIKRRHGEFEVAKQYQGPKRFLLPTGLVEIFREGIEESFPEICISSRTETGLRKIVDSFSLPLGHPPKED